MSDLTCKQVFEEKIPERLEAKPEVATSIKSSYQFVLNGEGGGKWTIDLTEPPGKVAEGELEDAAVVVTMEAKDFLELVTGKLNPQMAFMTGKLKIKGNIGVALKLQQVLG